MARNASSGDLPYNPVALFAFAFVAAIALMVAVVLVFAAIPVAVLLWLFSPGNRLDFDTKVMIGGATVFITLVLLFSMDPTAGLIALAITVIAGGFWYFNHPWFAAKEAYDREVSNYRPTAATPIESVIAYDVRGLALQIPPAMLEVAHKSMFRAYAEDFDAPKIPNFPAFDLRYEQRALAKVVRETREAIKIRKAQHSRAELTYDLVCDIFFTLIEATGPLPTAGTFEIPLYRILPEVRLIVHEWTQTLFQDEYVNAGVAKITRELQEEYCFAASAKHRSPSEIQKRGEMLANEHPGTDEEIINDYLDGTFMYDLMHLPVAIPVPERLRPEHAVIVAGSGGGKTQLLESFILADLDDEACPGVIVIDSKGELIERISRLAVFEPMTGALRDRLIIIDHKDRPALNMFDVDPEVVDTKINEVASLMRYFFGGLFGSQLSDQMDVLFLPLLHMILRMPGATLHTFAALVDDPTAFPDVVAKIPPGPRDFILNHYNDRGYAQTKTGIVTRLHRIINEVTLDDMFSASHNAVDIGKALNEGKIILVSTDADGLQDLSPIFGKYFIAQVMNAGLSRGSRQRDDRRPIHFYIDECAPYVDDKLAQMLTTIRSYGIGLMMAFQGVWQMKSHTAVITGNTGIKVMGSVEDDSDAKAFASSMRTDPKFIMSQRKVQGTGQFAVYTRDLSHAIPVTLPFGMLDKRPQMGDAAYEKLRRANQAIVTGKAVSLGGILIPQTKARPIAPVAVVKQAPERASKPPSRKIDPDSGERTKPTGNWEP